MVSIGLEVWESTQFLLPSGMIIIIPKGRDMEAETQDKIEAYYVYRELKETRTLTTRGKRRKRRKIRNDNKRRKR